MIPGYFEKTWFLRQMSTLKLIRYEVGCLPRLRSGPSRHVGISHTKLKSQRFSSLHYEKTASTLNAPLTPLIRFFNALNRYEKTRKLPE